MAQITLTWARRWLGETMVETMAKNKGEKHGGQELQKPLQKPRQKRRPATSIVTAGRDPAAYHGFVNPPVYHASTVLYPSAEDFRRPSRALSIRPARHADDRGARAGRAGARRPAMRGRIAASFRAGGDFGRAALGRACRRPRARHRQRLRADPRLLRSDPQPARRHHHLLRSADRRRDCRRSCSRTPARSSPNRPAR